MPERQVPQLQHLSLWRDGVAEHGWGDAQTRAVLNTAVANQEDLDNLRQIINTLIDVINGHTEMIHAIAEASDSQRDGILVLSKALDQLADNVDERVTDLNRAIARIDRSQP